jgi:KDO2-lipid IV(A) lauroyltransferase
MTQALADVWAEAIREHPQDWHMLQRFWLADLPGGDREAPAEEGA